MVLTVVFTKYKYGKWRLHFLYFHGIIVICVRGAIAWSNSFICCKMISDLFPFDMGKFNIFFLYCLTSPNDSANRSVDFTNFFIKHFQLILGTWKDLFSNILIVSIRFCFYLYCKSKSYGNAWRIRWSRHYHMSTWYWSIPALIVLFSKLCTFWKRTRVNFKWLTDRS